MDRLFQMLENAADGAFVINRSQRIIYWNQAAHTILGYTASNVVGRSCYKILRGCNDKGQPICYRRCPVFLSALAGEPVSDYDLVTQTESGAMRWINISILSVAAADKPAGLSIIHLFRDATQIKQNEHLIHQMFHAVDAHPRPDTLNVHPPRLAPEDTPQLTKREREVLSLLAHGSSTAEIAKKLSISPSTVRNHIQSILHTLQVHSRVEAVVYALEHNLAA